MPTAIYKPGDVSGSQNQWTVEPTGEIHANAVRDDDADTSYVFASVLGRIDQWPHDDAISTGPVPQGVEGIKIDSVTAFWRGRVVSGSRPTNARIRLGGVNYAVAGGPTWNSTTYSVKSQVLANNPAGGIWKAQHFAPSFFTEYGIVIASLGSSVVRITEAWLEVAYSTEPRRGLRTRGRSITPVGVGRIAHG